MTLSAENVAFAYKANVILSGFSLRAEKGRVLGLLGPNGAGKSTFLKIVANILAKREGRIVWDGVTDLSRIGRRELARIVAYVPQSAPAAFHLPVVDAVLLGRTPFFGMRPGPEDWEHVWNALDLLGLLPFAQRSVSELSGGQAQRVLIARALAQQPRLLLLDEPTSALDLKYQVETLSLVREVARASNVAIVIAIHDLNHAARFCDEVAFLTGGTVVAHGTPAETYSPEVIEAVYGLPVEVDSSRRYVEVRPQDDHRADAAPLRSSRLQ